jgi:hypothetical protein
MVRTEPAAAFGGFFLLMALIPFGIGVEERFVGPAFGRALAGARAAGLALRGWD